MHSLTSKKLLFNNVGETLLFQGSMRGEGPSGFQGGPSSMGMRGGQGQGGDPQMRGSRGGAPPMQPPPAPPAGMGLERGGQQGMSRVSVWAQSVCLRSISLF